MTTTYLLYTRAGCCLCEGLEERLRELLPSEALRLVDVDGDPALRARYGLTVPVLALVSPGAAGSLDSDGPLRDGDAPPGEDGSRITLLPPVPPRLKGEPLRAWLGRHTSQ